MTSGALRFSKKIVQCSATQPWSMDPPTGHTTSTCAGEESRARCGVPPLALTRAGVRADGDQNAPATALEQVQMTRGGAGAERRPSPTTPLPPCRGWRWSSMRRRRPPPLCGSSLGEGKGALRLLLNSIVHPPRVSPTSRFALRRALGCCRCGKPRRAGCASVSQAVPTPRLKLPPATPHTGRASQLERGVCPLLGAAAAAPSRLARVSRAVMRSLRRLLGLLRHEDAEPLLQGDALPRKLVVRREAGCKRGASGERAAPSQNSRLGQARTWVRRVGRDALWSDLLQRWRFGGVRRGKIAWEGGREAAHKP